MATVTKPGFWSRGVNLRATNPDGVGRTRGHDFGFDFGRNLRFENVISFSVSVSRVEVERFGSVARPEYGLHVEAKISVSVTRSEMFGERGVYTRWIVRCKFADGVVSAVAAAVGYSSTHSLVNRS